MQPGNSSSRKRLYSMAGAVAFVLACLIVDFLPRHGPPHFRYTGSDPTSHVWNLGWPLALFVYDPRSGLHVGPFAYVVLPFELFLAAGSLVVVAVRRLRNTPVPRTATASRGAVE